MQSQSAVLRREQHARPQVTTTRSSTPSSLRAIGRQLPGVLAPVLVVALGCLFASDGRQEDIGSWGLVQALPLGYFVCLGLLSLSFLAELLARRTPGRPLVLTVHLMGIIVLLHGAPALLEREPRFPTAWLHVGFVGQILENHVAPGTVDARFNWPGFFSSAAAVTGAGGLDDALPLLRWAPVVMVTLYLVPLHLIGRQLTTSSTATWLGLWIFVLVNWVGQDYFAPQSLAFLLYLVAIAVLVTFFRETPPGKKGRHTRWIGTIPFDGRGDVTTSPGTRTFLLGVLVLVVVVLAMSHQLTPIMLTVVSAALVLVGRCRLTVLPLVAGIVTLAWISVGATDYWVGHLHVIFGGFGDVHSVVSSSVGERVEGSPGHLAVVRFRLAVTAGLWGLMALAAVRLTQLRRPPLTLFTLAIAPFLMLLQNYGSEGILRLYLFSSPFAALLIAQVVVLHLPTKWVPSALMAALLVMLPVFVVTRFGNETFEQVRSSEVSALRDLYTTVPEGSVLLSPTSQVPWRFEQAVEHKYRRPDVADAFIAADPAAVRDPVSTEPKGDGKTYLVVTRSQILYAHEALGHPEDWFESLEPLLTPANGYHLLQHDDDIWIYQFRRRP